MACVIQFNWFVHLRPPPTERSVALRAVEDKTLRLIGIRRSGDEVRHVKAEGKRREKVGYLQAWGCDSNIIGLHQQWAAVTCLSQGGSATVNNRHIWIFMYKPIWQRVAKSWPSSSLTWKLGKNFIWRTTREMHSQSFAYSRTDHLQDASDVWLWIRMPYGRLEVILIHAGHTTLLTKSGKYQSHASFSTDSAYPSLFWCTEEDSQLQVSVIREKFTICKLERWCLHSTRLHDLVHHDRWTTAETDWVTASMVF